MKLILVESPTKARTLQRFLGKDYRIEATFGHLRDLPKGELGVDTKKDFTPKYVIPRDKARRVKQLQALVNDEPVILATDPDREGEAIAYHLAVILSHEGKITSNNFDTNKFLRITFHEITENAINQALANPGKINFQLVNAQQARRVLDRLVGYKLSPLLWKKLSRSWLSAGRVQSVALRLIVEREREIEKFKKEEYWVISGNFQRTQSPKTNDQDILAELVAKDGVKYEQTQKLKLFDGEFTFSKTSIADKDTADKIITDLKAPFTVTAVDKKETKRNPPPPYTTSALQIDAGRRLGFTSKKTMQIAQKLYEEGLITYHRTDSVNLATKFLAAAKSYIEKNYGKEYWQYRTYATKSKLAQEAHEAIRPTSLDLVQITKIKNQSEFRSEHEKLYDLILRRSIASQMAAAAFDSTTIEITSANGYQFATQGSIVKFDGYLKVAGYDSETVVLPQVKVGESLKLVAAIPQQKFTQPPPRYSEASLIKALEDDGIGRPSTYAPTISTIQERQYVTKETKEDGRPGRHLIPTELGFLVNDFLVTHFSEIVDLPFTAKMEDELDQIAQGQKEWVPVIREFYTPFAHDLEKVEKTAEKVTVPVEKTGEKCPLCGQGEVVIKQGKFGKFYACSRFPECNYTRNMLAKIEMKCPECGQGDVVVRKTRRGRIFYGCSFYPDCKWASWTKPKK